MRYLIDSDRVAEYLKRLLLPQPDLLIAATALQHNLVLVTRNTAHFQRIPQLPLYQTR